MTPSEIEVLFHCDKRPSIRPMIEMPWVWDAITSLLDQEMIVAAEKKADTYITTDKGSVHISQLCNLALPVPVWGDANGKIIKLHNQGE